jgi:hypothetical protein
MARLQNFVVVGFAAAVTLGASSASAGRQVHGGDVARVLAGKAFQIECVDGTQGRGHISQAGAISVSYRRASSGPEQSDHANVKVQGVEICLAWKQFGGGGNGCYPVFEQASNRFRLGSGPIWCDISAK